MFKSLVTKPRSVFDKRFFSLPKLIFNNLLSGDFFFFGKGEERENLKKGGYDRRLNFR